MTRRVAAVPLLAALAVVAAACTAPLEEAGEEADAPSAPLGSEQLDPAARQLAQEVERLVDLLATAHAQMEEATAAADLTRVRGAAAEAEGLLVGEPGADGDVLFPVESLDRGEVSDRDDLMTRTLTAAREAGGEDGREVTESIRDVIAGDIGAWQRDADGMLEWVDEVATPRDSIDATEEAVLELPGGGTQALVYLRLIERTDSLERAQAYAERAAAHLAVARTMLAELGLEEEEA